MQTHFRHHLRKPSDTLVSLACDKPQIFNCGGRICSRGKHPGTSVPDQAFSPSPRQTLCGGCGEQPWKWSESCCFIRQRRQSAFRPFGSVTRTGLYFTRLLGKSGSTSYCGIDTSVTIVLPLRSLPCTSRPTRSSGSNFLVQIRYLGPTITLLSFLQFTLTFSTTPLPRFNTSTFLTHYTWHPPRQHPASGVLFCTFTHCPSYTHSTFEFGYPHRLIGS